MSFFNVSFRLKQGLLFFTVILTGLLIGYGFDFFNPYLEFHREAIGRGQIWRLLTANLVHLNFKHALMNMAALGLVLLMFNRVATLTWVYMVAVLSIVVTVSLFYLDIYLIRYVGLSGVLYGLWVFGALATWREQPLMSSAVLALMFFAVYQQQSDEFNQDYLQSWIDGTVIVNAHLYGLLGGLILGLVVLIKNEFTKCQ